MEDPSDKGLDLERVRETFEESTDFTIGLEEEFALVDPATLELVDRFDELFAAAQDDEVLAPSVRGELIGSEIEIRSGRGETFADAEAAQQLARARLFALAEASGVALAATGTHPWAAYLDQTIIDTPHYQRLKRELRWVAQRNNTWSLHVHVGIRGADRAVQVCDRLRELLPALLAVSANSPFLDGRDTGLHSVRSQIFTRTFPRCGVPDAFGGWDAYAGFVDTLERVGSIVEATQLWWSVRPHHSFGTVEVRICDAQSRGEESLGLARLISAAVAQSALDLDDGASPAPLAGREIEENLWRAIRHGADAELIDFRASEVLAPGEWRERLLEWCAPAAERIGVELALPEANGAQRARAAHAAGAPIERVFADSIAETRRTYAPEGAPEGVVG